MKRIQRLLLVLIGAILLQSSSPQTEARPLDRGMVSFSFDDGWNSLDQAYLILNKAKIKGTAFVITGDVDTEKHVLWPQLWNMHWYGGWEISNHTVTHTNLMDLTDDQIRAEVNGAQEDLKKHGFLSGAFNPPYGTFDARVVNVLKSLGYVTSLRRAWTEGNEALNYADTFDPWSIKVVSVERDTPLIEIHNLIDQCAENRAWLVLVIHEVVTTPQTQYQISTGALTEIAKHVRKMRKIIDPVTISEGVEKSLLYKNR